MAPRDAFICRCASAGEESTRFERQPAGAGLVGGDIEAEDLALAVGVDPDANWQRWWGSTAEAESAGAA